jgi:hypothetical protein
MSQSATPPARCLGFIAVDAADLRRELRRRRGEPVPQRRSLREALVGRRLRFAASSALVLMLREIERPPMSPSRTLAHQS